MDPRFELDPQSLAAVTPQKQSAKTIRKSHKADAVGTSSGKGSVYTIKPGDHLFKILMRDYGLSNAEAESFIEEIRHENNIYDIKKLKIGQKIVIPPVKRRADGTLKLVQPVNAAAKAADAETTVGQSFVLESPVKQLDNQDAFVRINETLSKIIPQKDDRKPLVLQTSTFSLTLDPQRYPTLTAMDGARILLDHNSSIPPLIKSLIEEKDSKVRIVSYTNSGSKQFLSSVLDASGFYSLEENFNMNFGSDPRLTVQTDYKIEKTAESLLKHDVVLLNSNRVAIPSVLSEFLKKEGFTLFEPFASQKAYSNTGSRPIHVVNSSVLSEITDSILSAFSVPFERDRSIDVYGSDNNGISLSVKADRLFEHSGQKYVVTRFDGDPVNYTLFRILETKGYRVVILEANDDFRQISNKIISRMKIQGSYSQHTLLNDKLLGYSVQMSGVKLEDKTLPGGSLFLTNLTMDRIIKDLLTENGYSIKGH